jgi:small subunit ribosomal protein S6e
MPFKINISEKTGKTFHLETESKEIIEKELHDKIKGEDISPDLAGYEFDIKGASDNAGFSVMENVEGIGLKKVLLTYGKGMKKKPRKEGKKKLSKNRPKGLRLRKTVRGKVISPAITQINLKVLKQGNKKLEEIFPEQNKSKEEVKPLASSSESQTKEEVEQKQETEK